jgi:hypothetical protein
MPCLMISTANVRVDAVVRSSLSYKRVNPRQRNMRKGSMKYLNAGDGFWKIDTETDKLYWTSNDLNTRNDFIKLYGSIWVEQIGGVSASGSHAIKNYPEVSEGEVMLELI